MNARIEKLSQMLDKHYRRYTETFTDKETGKSEIVNREDISDWVLSKEERQLIEAIAGDVRNLSDEDLFEFQKQIANFKYRAFDEIYIEMVRRGEDIWASKIESPATLQELSDKGNKYAGDELMERALACGDLNKRSRRRPVFFTIRNLAGIQLMPEATIEITHLKRCVEFEYPNRYYYYFQTDDMYCVIEERAFKSYKSLLEFIKQLNPDPRKTDIVEEPVPLSSHTPDRFIYIVRE